jgi:hypothetical protein
MKGITGKLSAIIAAAALAMTGCSPTAATNDGPSRDTTDTTAPTAGAAISFSNTSESKTTVNWGAASDETTAQAEIKYKLVKANSAGTIDTIAEADAITGSDLAMDWIAGSTSCSLTALTTGASYYFAALAKDGSGNIVLYAPREVLVADYPAYLGRLAAEDGAANDLLGTSVAVSGDYAIVGARRKNGDTGAAYIYVRKGSTWVEQQKITASDATAGDFFGTAVGISGNYAIIGASGKKTTEGAAYIFGRSGTTWTEIAKLDRPASSKYFGNSVAISGDTVIVGNYQVKEAYAFVRSGAKWPLQQKLVPKDGTEIDSFGEAVAISGDTAIIGAGHFCNPGTTSKAAAYFFTRTGTVWTEQQKVADTDPTNNDCFGSAVSLSGDWAIIGAGGYDKPAENTGTAYIYERSGSVWSLRQQLKNPDDDDGDIFGNNVALSGKYAIISSPFASSNIGAAFIYSCTDMGWIMEKKIAGSTVSATPNYFGDTVAIDGPYVIVGNKNNKDIATDQGAAFSFKMYCD